MAKVKMKSNRAAVKRFRLSGSGKIVRRKAGRSHILTKKSRKRKRSLGQSVVVSGAGRKVLRRLMPSV